MENVYRDVIKRSETRANILGQYADNTTKAELARAFAAMLEVVDIIEDAKIQIPFIRNQNMDLKDEAVRQRAGALASEALEKARAAYGRANSTIATLEKRLDEAIRPKLSGGDASAIQLQLLNLKSDLKMVFDPIDDDHLIEAMIAEAKDAIVNRDDLTTYLLGADPWAERYLRSRKLEGKVLQLHTRVAEESAPLQTDLIKAQTTILSHIRAKGTQGGIKAVLLHINNPYLPASEEDLETIVARV